MHPLKGQQNKQSVRLQTEINKGIICKWLNYGYVINHLLSWDGEYGPTEKMKLHYSPILEIFLFWLESFKEISTLK